jgi:putative spermidine/putrescine transport system substrate-binding protein
MTQPDRILSRLALVALLGMTAACGGPKPSPEVTVVGWGGSSQEAHRQAYWTSFSKAAGVKVKEDTWHGGVGVLRAKAEAGQADWDVIQVEVEELILGCEEGIFEKLDWTALGGRDAFIAPSVNDCGVGAMVWSELFAYDGDRIAAGPKSWADFWDVKRFPGKRGMRKSPKYTLEAALMADGVAPSEVYKVLATPNGVDRAFHKLDQLKPHILWWSSVSQVPDLLASGEVAMSMATPGRLVLANQREHRNFKVVWDGNIYAVDFWAIPSNSRHKAEALELVKFMTRPENEVRLPQFIPTGLSNKAAIAQASAALKRETPSNPDNMRNALALDAEFWVENSDQLTQRFNAWAAR